MMRIRSKINPEIAPEQRDFLERKGTSNAIYILRTISERALEMQNEFSLCFIDYTRTFDCVRHQEFNELLERLNVDEKDLIAIRNLQW